MFFFFYSLHLKSLFESFKFWLSGFNGESYSHYMSSLGQVLLKVLSLQCLPSSLGAFFYRAPPYSGYQAHSVSFGYRVVVFHLPSSLSKFSCHLVSLVTEQYWHLVIVFTEQYFWVVKLFFRVVQAIFRVCDYIVNYHMVSEL